MELSREFHFPKINGGHCQHSRDLLGLGGPEPGSLISHTAHDDAISLWKESDSHKKVKKQKLEGGMDLMPCLGTQGLGVDFEE